MRIPCALPSITPAGGGTGAHKTVYDMKIQLHRWLGVAVAWLGITSASAYDFQADGIYYKINNDGATVTVTNEYNGYGCSYTSEKIEIPSSVSYNGETYSVTSIASYAFSVCENLTSIVIPESVTTIGAYAFYYSTGLTSIVIPKSVASIGSCAFEGCDLQSIVVAEGNMSYSSSEGVLFNKDKTVLIQYPGGKSGAYVIPSSVTSIDPDAFHGCTGLTSVTIPELVTIIVASTFFNCTGLTEVTIPESVTTIGVLAFYNCTGLETIKSYATIPPAIEANTFSSYNATLYVPVDCGDAYREAEYWANFTNIVESIDSRVEALQDEKARIYMVDNTLHVENSGKVYQVYTLAGQLVYTGNGTTVPLTNTGVYIVHMGDYIQKVIVR